MKAAPANVNSLKSGFLNKDTAKIGLREPSPRTQNTRLYTRSFASLNTTVVALGNYFLIEQPGKSLWLSPASDNGACAIVHVDAPGNPHYLTPGVPLEVPQGFTRLYFERPTQPAVPARVDLFYLFEVSDRLDGFKSAPLPLTQAQGGANNFQAPGKQTVAVLQDALTVPQTIVPALPGQRAVSIKNVSTGVETVWITLDLATVGQDANSSGVVAELAPGEVFTIAYTGAIGAFASAITAKVLPFGLV